MPRVSALAPLAGLVPSGGARLVARVLASAVLTAASVAPSPFATVVPTPPRAVVLPFGGRLEGMRLRKEALDRVDQVANSRGALAALLCAPAGSALVLQGMEAIRVKGHLLLKLVHHVWGHAMHFSAVTGQTLLTGVKRLERRVLAGVGAREGPPTRVAM